MSDYETEVVLSFICSCFEGIHLCEMIVDIGKYTVDMVINDKVVVENNNAYVNHYYDKRIKDLNDAGYIVINFNPTEENFDLSVVIRKILLVL